MSESLFHDNETVKVAYLIRYFHPFKGGAEQNFLNLALSVLRQRGNEVIVYTSDRKQGEVVNTRTEVFQGIQIKRFRPILRYRMYFVVYIGLLIEILKDKPDVIHASGFGFIWHDLCMLFVKLLRPKTKFINTPHGPIVVYKSTGGFERLAKGCIKIFEKIFINWIYDIVIQVNPNQSDWISEYGVQKSKIEYLPNGLTDYDLDLISKISESKLEKFITKHNLTNKTVLTYTGRFSYYKGVEHLLEAYANLLGKNKDLHLFLIGRDDGYLDTIRSKIAKLDLENYVTVLENASDEDKYLALSISKIFTLPSEWEAFGVVYLEAMATGNAIISTRTEGGNYLFKDELAGLLFDYGDVDQLTNQIQKLITDKDLRAKLSKNGRKLVKGFHWSKIGTDYLKILKKLI